MEPHARAPSRPLPANTGRSGVATETVTFAAIQSLLLAAGGGYVFCASVGAVPAPGGYFDFSWTAAIVALAVVWLIAFAVLLVLGLVHTRNRTRRGPWLMVAWVIAVAASTAIGWWNIRYFALWVSANNNGIWQTTSRPDWHPLIAAAAQSATGAAMIALIALTPRNTARG